MKLPQDILGRCAHHSVHADLSVVLLDQCRFIAGARQTASAWPRDLADIALAAALPSVDRVSLSKQIEHIVELIGVSRSDAFTWYPATCRWPSADEDRLLSALTATLDGDQVKAIAHANQLTGGLAANGKAVQDLLRSMQVISGLIAHVHPTAVAA